MSTAFTHQPRPPVSTENYLEQRRYGKSSIAAFEGVCDHYKDENGAAMARTEVYRCRPGDCARLSIEVIGARSSTRIWLDSDGLRELARCLIDAAADIEADVEADVEKPAAQGAA